MRLAAAQYQELLASLLTEGQAVLTRLRGVSMTPAVPDGALARIEPLDRLPRVGEIVLTRTPRGLLCHRVVEVGREAVRTWGDVCAAPDAAVAPAAVLGKVVALQTQGHWRSVRRRPRWHVLARCLKQRLCRRHAGAPAFLVTPDQSED